MNRTERRAAVFLALAAYVGGSIVAASVLSLPGGVRTAVLPGVFYLAAVRALAAFAAIATVGPGAMNALYALAGYVGWWVAGYLLGARGLGVARGELKALALAYPGVVGVAVSVALLVGGALGAAGLLGDALPLEGFLALLLVGGVLWVPSLGWLSRARSRQFGWQSRPLERVDAAVEVGGYGFLLAGLGLVGVAVAVDVGPQYLVVALLLLVVAAVTVAVPTGGTREPGPGF